MARPAVGTRATRTLTLTPEHVEMFAQITGDRNPLWLDADFARESAFGARTAPPMLCFCLGFAAWLRELLALPLPGESSAGHLGDRFRVYAAVPLACSRILMRPV